MELCNATVVEKVSLRSNAPTAIVLVRSAALLWTNGHALGQKQMKGFISTTHE